MGTLVAIGWFVWVVSASGLLARWLECWLARRAALKRVLEADILHPTLHQIRILKNNGDSRDPIERHQDAMTTMTRVATLVAAALALWFFGSVT